MDVTLLTAVVRVGRDDLVDLAGDVAFQAADGFQMIRGSMPSKYT
jgi:hypothetical protein